MRCPVCNVDMIVVEHASIELDFCTRCRGVWFDSGEVELLMEKMKLPSPAVAAGGVLQSGEPAAVEKTRRCPLCRRKMKKSFAGQQHRVTVDVCPLGEGMWFDGGEVDQLAGNPHAPAEPGSHESVLDFVGEVFQAGKQSQNG